MSELINQSLHKAMVMCERSLLKVQTCPSSIYTKNPSSGKWKSIHDKLTELYLEETSKESKYKNFKSNTLLLKKLVQREKFNYIVVNLYPGNDGYSLQLKEGDSLHPETLRLPYEETSFLQYIDNKDLPPIIIDLVEQSQFNLFYSGCVIVEVRDYRRCPSWYSSEFVLLKPSTQTLIADINAMTADSQKWSYDDKQQLESSLLLATSGPLCLDPSVAVTFAANHIQYEENVFNYCSIKKNLRKYSQVAMNRRKRLNQLPGPSNLKLHDFIKKRNIRLKNKKTPKPSVDTWRQRQLDITLPMPIELPQIVLPEKPSASDLPLQLVEKFILEADKKEGKIYTKLTVRKRTSDNVHIGSLYVDRDYVEGQKNGATCHFDLGSKLQVSKYINQFREIFTEEGRKAVKITHVVPGQPNKVSLTQGMREKNQNSLDNDANSKKISTASSNSANVPTLITQVSNPELTKSLSTPAKTSLGAKVIPRQVAATANRVRIESNKVAQNTSLPSYTQALSAAVKQNTRSPQFIKKSEVENITIASADPQTVGNLGAGDIIVNPASISCQNTSINIPNFPQNFSLHNITRVPQFQVSLTAVPPGLAVPISISMVDPSQTTAVVSSTNTSNVLTCASPSSSTLGHQTVSIAPTSSLAPTVMVSSNVVNSQPSVIAAPTSVLSLPVGMAGSLNTQNLTTQLMTTGLKGATSGFRTSTGGGLSLLQVSGTQQPIPLFNQVSQPVLSAAAKPVGSVGNEGTVQQSLLTLTPQQQQLQFALQKQQFQQLQQLQQPNAATSLQLQLQQSPAAIASKPKQQKRTILKPQK